MWTLTGFVYVAFVVDVHSRRILGWRVSTSKEAPMVTDALKQALTTRKIAEPRWDAKGLIHHSDAGSQGGFQWSSQHLDVGGVRWDARGSKCHKRRPMLVGSGRRIGHYGRRCDHRADRNPRARWSARSGA